MGINLFIFKLRLQTTSRCNSLFLRWPGVLHVSDKEGGMCFQQIWWAKPHVAGIKVHGVLKVRTPNNALLDSSVCTVNTFIFDRICGP